MSWLDDAGGVLWDGAKVAGRGAAAVGTGGLSEVAIRGSGALFGSGTNPGILGTGQYQVTAPEVNMAAGEVPHASDYRARLDQAEAAARGRATPTVQAAQIDTTAGNQVRGQQQALAGQLQQAANGEGPSVAQEQLRQGLTRNLASTVAATNSTRGLGASSAAARLQASRAGLGQQAAADAATLRAQEVTAARGQLAGVLGDTRQADLATASQQAQLGQQAALANQQATLEDNRQKDALTQQYLAMGMSLAQAEQAAAMRMEELRVQSQLEAEQIRSGAYTDAAGRRIHIAEDVARGIGQAAGAGAGGAPAAP